MKKSYSRKFKSKVALEPIQGELPKSRESITLYGTCHPGERSLAFSHKMLKIFSNFP